MPELPDIQPILDQLQHRSEQAADARSKCLEVIKRNFERGSDIAATVAGRLAKVRWLDRQPPATRRRQPPAYLAPRLPNVKSKMAIVKPATMYPITSS